MLDVYLNNNDIIIFHKYLKSIKGRDNIHIRYYSIYVKLKNEYYMLECLSSDKKFDLFNIEKISRDFLKFYVGDYVENIGIGIVSNHGFFLSLDTSTDKINDGRLSLIVNKLMCVSRENKLKKIL